MNEEILYFYKQTSIYTYLGLYKNFAKNLTNDVKELCLLQRGQIIHPVVFDDKNIRNFNNTFWGDMTKVPITRLRYEDDLFPTASSMLIELFRKNSNYTIDREAKDKIHTTCRSQAILLAAILKAKDIPARVRSGYAPYIKYNGVAFDHWITEYYDNVKKRWILVDADMCCDEVKFDIYDIPKKDFLFGADAWLGLRRGEIKEDELYYAGYSYNKRKEHCMEAIIRGLFYDFHCVMNDEIIFLHLPKYVYDENFKLSEEELNELDRLAELMLDLDKNFNELLDIWENNIKFRIMSGALN